MVVSGRPCLLCGQRLLLRRHRLRCLLRRLLQRGLLLLLLLHWQGLRYGAHTLRYSTLRPPLLLRLLLQQPRLLLLCSEARLLGLLRLHVGGAQSGMRAAAGLRWCGHAAHATVQGRSGGGQRQRRHGVGGQRLHAHPLCCLLSQQLLLLHLPLLLHPAPGAKSVWGASCSPLA